MKKIQIKNIAPDPLQPRKTFDAAEMKALEDSILANGLLQPITVRARRGAPGKYVIAYGERRWRALSALVAKGHKKFASIPCMVEAAGARQDLRVRQIVENIARADMPILEEADAIAELAKTMSEEEISERTGMVAFKVRWRLQLQNLAPEIRTMVAAGQLDRQQAMEIARVAPAQQTRLVQMINRRELVGWKAVRNAVDSIVEGHTQADIFGADAPKVSEKDAHILSGMEAKIAQMAALVSTGWKDGACIIASRVNPDRAQKLAGQIDAIKLALSSMSRELHNVSAQVRMVA